MDLELKLNLRRLKRDELQFAHKLTQQENWGTSLFDLEQIFNFGSRPIFIAYYKGEPTGVIFGINYGTFGFIGNFIVSRNMRGKGIGRALIEKLLNWFENKNINTIFLDAVPKIVPLYVKFGFNKICKSLRFQGKLKGLNFEEITPISEGNWSSIVDFDRKYFKANRESLLKTIFNNFPKYCKCIINEKKIQGYIMGTEDSNGTLKIGPMVCTRKCNDPSILIRSLIPQSEEKTIKLGVLESNQDAIKIYDQMKIKEAHHSIRMVKGSQKCNFSQIYAIAGPDRG